MSTMTFDVNGRVITITARMLHPAEAADLLSRNKRNRKLNPQRVAQLVNDIRDGAFKFNGDTIRLASTDGQYDDLLIDAQHRLQACVDSGLPIPVIIVGNLDPDVSDTIDQGTARTVLDILKLTYGREVTNGTTVAAMAPILWAGEGRGASPARVALAQYVNDNIEAMERWGSAAVEITSLSPQVAVQGNRLIKAMAPGVVGALMYYMTSAGGSPTLVHDFFHRIATGIISSTDTSNVIPSLRRRQSHGMPLSRMGGGGSIGVMISEYWVYINCYNRWLNGVTTKAIRLPQKEIRTFADMPAIDPYRTAEDKLAEQNALIQHFTRKQA